MPMKRLLRGLRRRLRKTSPRPCILMYHRVAPFTHDPWALCVTPQTFDKQMEYLRQHRIPMALDDLVASLKRGDLPRKAVSVTFDDAYRDNLVHARPVLAKHDIPATVFVPTGCIGRDEPFWWDELGSMILEAPGAHASLFRCGGEEIELRWGAMETADLDPAWRGWTPARSQRQNAFYAVWSKMQKLSDKERKPMLAELRVIFPTQADLLALPMSATELNEMIRGDLVRLGAHTVTHASLSDTDEEEARLEIQGSRQQCRALTQTPVEGFAYPYGNMTPEACIAVEAAGFSYACAAQAGFLDRGTTDFYRLPRVPATNVSDRAFSALLAG